MRAAAADYAQAQPRAARRLQDGRRRRPHLGRHERQGRRAQGRPRGQGEGARRGSSSRRSSRSASTSAAAARRRRAPGRTHITDKEWKDLAKDLHKPLDCHDMNVLADFFKKHGAIPPYENTYMGGAPMPPGGERKTTSFHYACGNSGAIDLNYPAGIEASVINEVRPHLIKLGFHTLWQVENHFDHMHVDFQGSASPTGFGGGARRGRLADRLVPAGQARRLGRAVAGRPRGLLRRRPRRHPVRPAGPEDRERDLPGARPLQRLREGPRSRRGRRRSSSRA